MSSERPVNPRFDEDVHFNLVKPGPPRYLGGIWHARLTAAKGRGIEPSQAFAEPPYSPEGNRGRVVPGSLAHAPNSAAVKSLAQEA
ncbi:hypothetical protein ACFYZB_43345 [Streptomyces sp. NPDC001852]|uniref:hypothetical protein n=1 Tax=Streptomyces sp. NPDC001852 TaxID=3364619 RepID=UPI0036BE72FB